MNSIPAPARPATRRSLGAALLPALLAGLTAGLAGCSDPAAPAPPADPGFTAELSGVLEARIEGPVEVSMSPDGSWRLTLTSHEGGERIRIWSRPGSGPVGPGEYTLVDSITAGGGAAEAGVGTDVDGGILMARVEVAPNTFPNQADFDFLVGTLSLTSATDQGAAGLFDLATTVYAQPTRALVVRGVMDVP
ncbi:hypothetical protein V3331_09515 [Gaopeijia maritima]|uniref:hypothetical protein n=1 Tax=Gaopeijia maritima TaxID=3119007 RepID=UPI0032541588